ncbi:MAG: spore protease YyaC [Thermosipho sp. (in: Bacteria)]|nr:spore protease YyaC [Thermosipho sp. (in: thermotogales)]
MFEKSFYYKDNILELKNNIIEAVKFIKKDFKEIAIVNIGTDRCTGDCFAPLVGTLIKSDERFDFPNVKVYGDLNEPIHAKNLEEFLEDFNKQVTPDTLVIAIDACLGKEEDIGFIKIKSEALSPGRGLDKDLPKVGDICINGIISENSDFNIFTLSQVKLGLVYSMAEVTRIALKLAIQELYNENYKIYKI